MDTSNGIGSENRWTPLWYGRARVRSGIVKLFWVIIRFFLGNWLWGTAVRLAHFQPPTKTVGVVLALGSVFLTIWALWDLGQALLILGVKRLTIVIFIAFASLVAINVLTIPDTRPIGIRFAAQLSDSVQQVEGAVSNWVKYALQAPDDFLFAYSGRRNSPPLPPGFPTPDPEATPIQAFSFPANGSSPATYQSTPTTPVTDSGETTAPQTTDQPAPPSLEIGSHTIVVNTGGQPLRARAEPGTGNEIVARFPTGTRLLILEGPKLSDDFNWWRVRSENGEEGWCADQWLAPADD